MKDKMEKIYSKREELWKQFEKEFWKQFDQTINFSDYLNAAIPKSEIRKNKIEGIIKKADKYILTKKRIAKIKKIFS